MLTKKSGKISLSIHLVHVKMLSFQGVALVVVKGGWSAKKAS